VLEDQDNALRSVVFFNGLIKTTNLCGAEFIANINQTKNMLSGLLYKQNRSLVDKYIEKLKIFRIEKVSDLIDVDYKLERISGGALDYYEIEGI
jgi:hypothetical protein